MAYTNIHTGSEPLFARIGHALEAAVERLAKLAPANSCLRECERLQRLSDAELAEQGLKREDIPMHAFRRFNYI
ncbi:DUF1127 domain-containing protein [Rhodovulum sp. DZ06]|uniref:DUF1127 domain-containing protein n=1 Tax=Rhodovulum sp. DZ06 TaxID=3425126 RepID=UPI003D340FA8